MTKAMGEMILNEIRGDVPLLIIRPAVIESSYKQPFPGWIQGNRYLLNLLYINTSNLINPSNLFIFVQF